MAPTNPQHRVRTNSDPLSRLSALSKAALGRLSIGSSVIVTRHGASGTAARVPLWAVIAAAVSGARGGLRVDPPALR